MRRPAPMSVPPAATATATVTATLTLTAGHAPTQEAR